MNEEQNLQGAQSLYERQPFSQVAVEDEMIQPPRRSNKGYNIEIRPLDFGYMVTVGCQSFAIETTDKLLSKLGEYLTSPTEVEKKYNKGDFKF